MAEASAPQEINIQNTTEQSQNWLIKASQRAESLGSTAFFQAAGVASGIIAANADNKTAFAASMAASFFLLAKSSHSFAKSFK